MEYCGMLLLWLQVHTPVASGAATHYPALLRHRRAQPHTRHRAREGTHDQGRYSNLLNIPVTRFICF